MKSKSWIALVTFALVVSGGLAGATTSWAQEEGGLTTKLYKRSVEGGGGMAMATPGTGPAVDPRIAAMREITAAAAAFRDATGDEAKSAVRGKLVALLDKYFDEDMKSREAELAKVEERVKKLRALFDKRAGKKQEIIDLQVKVLENEADGLGFFKPVDELYIPPTPGIGTTYPGERGSAGIGPVRKYVEPKQQTSTTR
jgi:hypothetical protein